MPDTELQPQVYTGREHKWGQNPLCRLNTPLKSLTPQFTIIAITALFHYSNYGKAFYEWLNLNYTPFEINLWWTFGISSVVYWLGGLLFVAADVLKPSFIYKYKIQPADPIPLKTYLKVFYIVARNQVLVALPVAAAIAYLRPCPTGLPLPGFFEALGTMIFGLVCEEIGFYYVHKTLHSPRFYKSFHKLHHEFTAPCALGATYCTLTEHLFSNILPILIGIILLGSHWSLLMMFFCSLECGTLCGHSNYNIPWLFDSLTHDWHHYSFTENYGPLGLLDSYYQTDKVYQSWISELKERTKKGGGDHRSIASKELAQMEAKKAQKIY